MARKVSDSSPGARSAATRRRRLPAARHGTLTAPVTAAALPLQHTPLEPAVAFGSPAPVEPAVQAESLAPERPVLHWHLVVGPDGRTRPEALWS